MQKKEDNQIKEKKKVEEGNRNEDENNNLKQEYLKAENKKSNK